MQKLGREVRNLDLAVWDVWKREVVFNANCAKFSQNPKAKELLLKTYPKFLAEASPYDPVWGIGLRADDPNATNIEKWKGANLLGWILMMVRNILENEMRLREKHNKKTLLEVLELSEPLETEEL